MTMTTRLKMLIADDDSEMRELLREILEQFGHTVESEVENGRDALTKINLNQPDIAFIDIEMPFIDGLGVLKELQFKKSSTYPIIISGHSTIDNVKTTLGLGAKGFVVKPYDPDKIKQILIKYWSEQQ